MIKKKPGWTIHYGPSKPILGRTPSKTIEKYILILEASSFVFDDIKIPQEYLDKGYSIKNLIFSASENYDCSNIIVELTIDAVNDNYKKDLARFEKEKEIFKIKLKVWQEENKLWEAWVEQEKDKILENQLNKAKQLLEKHNKI